MKAGTEERIEGKNFEGEIIETLEQKLPFITFLRHIEVRGRLGNFWENKRCTIG
jgi:hypothetical protein